MTRSHIAVLLGVFTFFSPATALGQSDGVTVDPNSPAGTEYAIPIQEARRQSGSDSGSDSQLFGEGVETDDSAVEAAEAKPHGTNGRKKHPKSADGGSGEAVASTETLESAAAAYPTGSSDDGSGAAVAVVGGSIALILVATLGGWFFRRRFDS